MESNTVNKGGCLILCRKMDKRSIIRTMFLVMVLVIMLVISYYIHQTSRSNINLVPKVKIGEGSNNVLEMITKARDEAPVLYNQPAVTNNRPPVTNNQPAFKVLRSYLEPNITITHSGHHILHELNKTIQILISDSINPNYMKEYHIKNQQQKVQKISCNRLMNNDSRYQHEMATIDQTWIKEQLFTLQWPQPSECQSFKQRQGYIVDGISKSELEFPLAYSILMHKDPGQVEHLLRSIYRPQNLYCIHIDKKSDLSIKKAMHALASCFDNVFIPETSISVYWGTNSVFQPELVCLELLLDKRKNTTKQWKYFINLTGQEFPLKTNWELVQILRAYNGASEVGSSVNRKWEGRWKCYRRGERNSIKYPIPVPHNYTMAKGTNHVVFSYELSNFVVNDPISKDLIQWLKPLRHTGETFFPTLFYSSQLKVPSAYTGPLHQGSRTSPDMVRYKLWHNCRGKEQRGICLGSIWELPYLIRSPNLFFNKFEVSYDPLAYYCLEEWHNNKTAEERAALEQGLSIHFETEAYQELPWVKYHL